jgi:hypothetical protein
MPRAVLLIACSKEEASTIREKAAEETRTISAYVLRIVMRSVQIDEKFFADFRRLAHLNSALVKPRPRTVVLIRCSDKESARIRATAVRRDSTISGYVIHCLRRSWNAGGALSSTPADAEPAQTNKAGANAKPSTK